MGTDVIVSCKPKAGLAPQLDAAVTKHLWY